MPKKCVALYSRPKKARYARCTVELEPHVLRIYSPDGQCRRLYLDGACFSVRDAACEQRFVRHLILQLHGEVADLITPPDEGAIAPRAARLPSISASTTIIDSGALDTVADWLQGRGRLSGRTIAELARLAVIASPQFAIMIGEWAGQMAVESLLDRLNVTPMRTSASVRDSLRPLELAARTSPRVADALVAALSRSSLLLRRS